MNKKSVFIVLIVLSILPIILPVVNAQYYGSGPFSGLDLGQGVRQLIDQTTNFFKPIFQAILGDYEDNTFFFTKVLLFILLFVVIFFILTRMPIFEGYRGVNYVIAMVISIIAIRFISENQLILGILLPYGTLGVALTTAIPFLIIFYGIHAANFSSLGRRLSWGFFGIVFVILWIYKSPNLSPISNQIYLWSLIALLVVFIFDKRIHYYFRGLEGKKAEEAIVDEKIAMLESKRDQLQAYAGPSPSREQRNTIDRYNKEIRRLRARRSHFS